VKLAALGIIVALGLFAFDFSSAKDVAKKKARTTAVHPTLKAAASFQFCFEIPHGRCFNTTATGRLRQVGGHSPSQAVITPDAVQAFEDEIAKFMKATISAAPRKPRDCQQSLAYRSFDLETLQMKFEAKRCLEFLNKADNAKLAKLVARLSLATKTKSAK
jgi:hypothetical protein